MRVAWAQLNEHFLTVMRNDVNTNEVLNFRFSRNQIGSNESTFHLLLMNLISGSMNHHAMQDWLLLLSIQQVNVFEEGFYSLRVVVNSRTAAEAMISRSNAQMSKNFQSKKNTTALGKTHQYSSFRCPIWPPSSSIFPEIISSLKSGNSFRTAIFDDMYRTCSFWCCLRARVFSAHFPDRCDQLE